jgi:disulfide oxidoreductase YuzD
VKDTADLELTLPTLSSDQAEWLNAALEIVHPNHHWIARVIEIL